MNKSQNFNKKLNSLYTRGQQRGNGSKLHKVKISLRQICTRALSCTREQFCTNGQFCTSYICRTRVEKIEIINLI